MWVGYKVHNERPEAPKEPEQKAIFELGKQDQMGLWGEIEQVVLQTPKQQIHI
jgi:hypothetical protein